MSFLAKEYEIPFLGKVELTKATNYDKSFNGSYYAENSKIGKFGKKSESVEELIGKVDIKLKNYFEKQIALSDEAIDREKVKKEKLELILGEITNLNTPEEFVAWISKYQTDNPLQLELQDVERERQKGDKK